MNHLAVSLLIVIKYLEKERKTVKSMSRSTVITVKVLSFHVSRSKMYCVMNRIHPNVLITVLWVKAGWLRDNKPSSLRGLVTAVVSYLIVY